MDLIQNAIGEGESAGGRDGRLSGRHIYENDAGAVVLHRDGQIHVPADPGKPETRASEPFARLHPFEHDRLSETLGRKRSDDRCLPE